MIIQPCTDDARVTVCTRYLSSRLSAVSGAPILILPIPSFRDGTHVTGTDLTVDSLSVPADGTVVGYAIPAEIADRIRSVDAAVCDVSRDEQFTQENAHLTAIGTLGYLLSSGVRVPEDLTVGVIGYGRIGRELLRQLLFFGARVKVFTTKELTRVALGRCGIETADPTAPSKTPRYAGLDILINTAPVPLIYADDLPSTPPRLLELASGENIPPDIPCERLPSLPARLYPESSGMVYGRSVLRMLGY